MDNYKSYVKIKIINMLASQFGWIAQNSKGVQVLTFHNIGDDDSVHTLNLRRFTDFLTVLSDNGCHTIRAHDLVDSWPARLNQERNVLLTFDDGYASHKDVVSDLLLRLQMTATFFVLSSLVDQQRTRALFAGGSNAFISRQDIKQMKDAGFEIGSHTHTHPLCGLITEDQFRQEITLSQEILEDATGSSITSFSYPYGREGAYTVSNRIALAESGYTAAFTQSGRRITRESDLLTLPRINIDRFDTVQTFQRKLSGNYELIFRIRNHGN